MIWFAIAAITSTPALALLAIVALGERDLIRHERTIADGPTDPGRARNARRRAERVAVDQPKED